MTRNQRAALAELVKAGNALKAQVGVPLTEEANEQSAWAKRRWDLAKAKLAETLGGPLT